jgi:amidohydrolase
MDDSSLAETLTAWRRHLHAHPEIGREEHATAAFIRARLDEMGIPYESGVGGTGVVATLARGGNRSVGQRADMDALPIPEATGLPYASTNPGFMHACGHDGHTTSLLGAAALLKRDPNWSGIVRLVFQPAEEGLGGAAAMLEDGLLDRFPMERIFAYHNWPGLAAGTVAVHDGPAMAAGARVAITLEGHAAHAAMPHLGRDPMLASAHLLIALQSLVSRNVDPLETAVVSICVLDGGAASNQIPQRVTLRGTIRFYKPAVGEMLQAGIRRISTGIAQTFGMTEEIVFTHVIPPVLNSGAEAALAAEVASELGLTVRSDMAPSMASEDFGRFLTKIPGAFVWIGNGPIDGGRELHSPRYDFNDAILPDAAKLLAGIARKALAG